MMRGFFLTPKIGDSKGSVRSVGLNFSYALKAETEEDAWEAPCKLIEPIRNRNVQEQIRPMQLGHRVCKSKLCAKIFFVKQGAGRLAD